MNISESLRRLLERSDIVTDLFYIKYLDRYPDLLSYFQEVDLSHQAVLLKMALLSIEQYYSNQYPAAKQYLLVLGHKHYLRQIPSDLYPDWRDCMLDTLEQVLGEEWNDELEMEWNDAINQATDVMVNGYVDELAY